MDVPYVPASTTRTPRSGRACAAQIAIRPLFLVLLALTLTLGLSAHARAEKAGPAEDSTISIDQIADTLTARIQDVRDMSARVSFVQVSERDGSRMEGEVHLAAIFPNLVRATWIKPDYLSGVIWILDSENNTFTQYIPVSGEAARHPLDKALEDQAALPFAAPQDLFTLPPTDQFDLVIVDEVQTNPHQVMVRATSKEINQAYLLLVDTSKWLVTQFQTLNAKGAVNFSAEARDIQVNQSLQAADLRRLPPGVIERSFP